MKKIHTVWKKAKKGVVYVLVAFGCFLVIANIIASQQLPPLFYSFVDGGRKAVVSYLSHIKSLPIFKSELLRYKNQYGADIQNEVFREDVERKREIEAIRAELKKQPRSRDLLYALSLLYKEDGNEKLAKEYLEMAKALDPTVRD